MIDISISNLLLENDNFVSFSFVCQCMVWTILLASQAIESAFKISKIIPAALSLPVVLIYRSTDWYCVG
jgi:hypothetical protein